MKAADLRIKIYADGADKAGMLAQYANPLVKGFTTNPSLMRKAGITDYAAFAKDILTAIPDRPISFEVFSDDFDEMHAQADIIRSWGPNVYVKIPVMNTKGESAIPLLKRLAPTGTKMNVTAIYTIDQVREVSDALSQAAPSNISVFAGRMADVGIDPIPVMTEALRLARRFSQQELLWASTREVFNVIEADRLGAHIITAPNDIIAKLSGLGKDAFSCSLDTVKGFYVDSTAAGFRI